MERARFVKSWWTASKTHPSGIKLEDVMKAQNAIIDVIMDIAGPSFFSHENQYLFVDRVEKTWIQLQKSAKTDDYRLALQINNGTISTDKIKIVASTVSAAQRAYLAGKYPTVVARPLPPAQPAARAIIQHVSTGAFNQSTPSFTPSEPSAPNLTKPEESGKFTSAVKNFFNRGLFPGFSSASHVRLSSPTTNQKVPKPPAKHWWQRHRRGNHRPNSAQ